MKLPKVDKQNTIRIRTPHAAMVIWNYAERSGSNDATGIGKPSPNKREMSAVEPLYITTVSAVSLSTSKSKSDPQGTFQAVLAPTKNWVGKITPGSWCAILMSNQPITEKDMQKLDPLKLKMFGKIDTVRLDTKTQDDGTRTTLYYMSGVDWGHVFHNILYIDNNLSNQSEPQNQGSGPAIAIQNILFGGKNKAPQTYTTKDNITALLGIFGKAMDGYAQKEASVGTLSKAVYDFNLPKSVAQYLDLKVSSGATIAPNINSAIQLQTGILVGPDKYKPTSEAQGFVNPFSLQGAHSFWEILQQNSCPPLNEMIAEMRPEAGGTSLILYNRIKPFAVKGTLSAKTLEGSPGGSEIISHFQNIKTHELDPMMVIAINAGTNWKDKYNFAEIKPDWADARVLEPTVKANLQQADVEAFNREGFRPIIYSSKYLPGSAFNNETGEITSFDTNKLSSWSVALKTWHFDTHKMLNGTVVLTGIDGYIGVGDNIKLDAAVMNPSHNFNGKQAQSKNETYLLAHVESVSNSFSVDQNGSRAYRTTIQFVRGIITTSNGTLYSNDDGAGAIDANSGSLDTDSRRNTQNTVSVSESYDPSPITGKSGR